MAGQLSRWLRLRKRTGRDRPAGLEQHLGEHLWRGYAYRVVGVYLVDGRAGYRGGQLPLAAGWHDAVLLEPGMFGR
jgi:hypothetical protein